MSERLSDGEALARASDVFRSMAGQMDDGEVKDLFWNLGLQMNHCANLATPGDHPWLWGRGGRKRAFHTFDDDGIALCLEADRDELERQVPTGSNRVRSALLPLLTWPAGERRGFDGGEDE